MMTERMVLDQIGNRRLMAVIEKGLERKLFDEEEIHNVLYQIYDGAEGVVYDDWRVRLARTELSAREKANIHDMLFHAKGKPNTHRSGKRMGRIAEGVITLRPRRARRKRW